jgi:hypothetical protein
MWLHGYMASRVLASLLGAGSVPQHQQIANRHATSKALWVARALFFFDTLLVSPFFLFFLLFNST